MMARAVLCELAKAGYVGLTLTQLSMRLDASPIRVAHALMLLQAFSIVVSEDDSALRRYIHAVYRGKN